MIYSSRNTIGGIVQGLGAYFFTLIQDNRCSIALLLFILGLLLVAIFRISSGDSTWLLRIKQGSHLSNY